MGERKVLNKYYPPDFDPSKIPKVKRPKNDQVKVRMMLPMSIRCNTCGEYLYKGKKFNSRKETVTGEEYLSIKIFRFYIKCTRCSAELTIKTDPQNSDYQCEWGASRNFEPWRENKKIAEEQKGKREKEEMGDAMKALENRTYDSKVEMDILDALDEIRSLNARQSKMDPIEILLQKQKEQEEEQERLNDEDEAIVRELYGRGEDGMFVKRIAEPENDDDFDAEFETEAAMRSLLVTPVDGMELFNASAKRLKPKQEDEVKAEPSIIKVTPKVTPKPKVVAVKKAAKVMPKIAVKIVPKNSTSNNGNTIHSNNGTLNNTNSNNGNTKKESEASKQALSSLLGYDDDEDEEK